MEATHLSPSPCPDEAFLWSVSLTDAMVSGRRFSLLVYRPRPPSVRYLQHTDRLIRLHHHRDWGLPGGTETRWEFQGPARRNRNQVGFQGPARRNRNQEAWFV